MTDQEFIFFLWQTGNFWNPKYPECLAVHFDDLPKLTLDHPIVKAAILSFHESDANSALFASSTSLDTPFGIVAPAPEPWLRYGLHITASLPRCPFPDHPPPRGTVFHYDDPDLQRAVERYQETAATGSGSWPAGCHGTAGVHEVKIHYDLSKLTAKHREWWPEIQRRSHQAMADVGVRLIEVANASETNITVYGKAMSGNVIGMAEFNNRTCGDKVFCQLNPNYAPDIDMVLNLLLHENGHNWNLEHKPGGIMNPSILRRPTYWVKREGGKIVDQDNSYPKLKIFFGGEPIDVPVPPIPPVPPVPPTPPVPPPKPPIPPPAPPIDWIKILITLLKSLVDRNDQAVREGWEGPLTATVNAWVEGQSPAAVLEAFCTAYVRSRWEERKVRSWRVPIMLSATKSSKE